MRDSSGFWLEKERLLARAGRMFRQDDPARLHELRIALRRLSTTAEVLGRGKVARRSKQIARSLSERRHRETDLRLLERVRDLGWLGEEAAAGIERLWSPSDGDGEPKRPTGLRKLRRAVSKLSREPERRVLRALADARRAVERPLASPPEDGSDRELRRYRAKVRRARYVAEDLAAAGEMAIVPELARERKLQDALGTWNDLTLFRDRLASTRADAETRGAVRLASEISGLLTALEPAVETARSRALAAAQRKASRASRPSSHRAG